ncbi:MAG: T9SS type A sorting domain-containing protein [Bacteroidetes bacterium]|nr:T9SS type A sorting domain-containing protein [Bacteroidota bacterium]
MKKFLLKFFTVALFVVATISFAIGQGMPDAISIIPEQGTGWDELTLTFNPALACSGEKLSLEGSATVAIHSGAFLIDEGQTGWGKHAVDFDKQSDDGTSTSLTDNGDGTYSITFTPAKFYPDIPDGAIITQISAVFNNGSGWDAEGKDFGTDEGCIDFVIPLHYESTDPAFAFKINMTKAIEDAIMEDPILGKVYAIVEGFEPIQLLDVDEEFLSDGIYEGVLNTGIVLDQSYNVSFRINDDIEETSTPRAIVASAGTKSINVWWNDVTGTVLEDLIINVDMSYQLLGQASSTGAFNPATDTLDVAGSFNGWGETVIDFAPLAGDTIYTATIPNVAVGTTYEYKVRINHDWENSEFAGGGANRKYTIREGQNTVNVYYDNYRIGWVPVTMYLNMSYQEQIGVFDNTTDQVDVQGTFNGWGGTDELFYSEGIYSVTVLAPVGDTIEYKFRRGMNWDNNEFAGMAPGRKYIVLDTIGGLTNVLDTVWYNDDNPAVAQAPLAKDLTVTGIIRIGEVLTGHYIYEDVNSDAEGVSAYQWYRSDDAEQTNIEAITEATNITYTLVEDDYSKNIFFEVTPVASVSTGTGDAPLAGDAVKVNAGVAYHTGIVSTNGSSIEIYPNPTKDVLHINNLKDVQILFISNMLGQQVQKINLVNTDKIQISTMDLNKGIYIITLVNKDGKSHSRKIIKK